MTQSHSAPAPAGSEHHVRPTTLALHVASAASWGRPWRHRALSLPSPKALTFQGIRLPLQPLRSWLHLLSRAGMLGVRRPAVSILSRPEEDEDVPTKIEDLGFEIATEMILDFANFARQSRLNSSAEQTPTTASAEISSVDEPSAIASSSGIDELHALGMADSVSSESVDQDFLGGGTPGAQGDSEVATAQRVEDVDLSPTLEPRILADEPLDLRTADVPEPAAMNPPDMTVPAERFELTEAESWEEKLAGVESPEVSTVETATSIELSAPEVTEVASAPMLEPSEVDGSDEHSVEEIVEQSQQTMTESEMPEIEMSVAMAELESEFGGASDLSLSTPEKPPVDMPETVVHEPVLAEVVAQPLPEMMVVEQAPHLSAPEIAVESDTVDEQVAEPTQPEEMSVPEEAKAVAPAIVVRGVRIARKPVVLPQPTVAQEPAAPSAGVALAEEVNGPAIEAVVAASLPEVMVGPAAQGEAETTAVDVPVVEGIAQHSSTVLAEDIAEPEVNSAAAVMYWEPVEPDQQPDLVMGDLQVLDQIQASVSSDEFGFEPMIASLEDALAVLATAKAVHDEVPTARVEPTAALNVSRTTFAPIAAEAQWVGDSLLEAAALQGIFIQKETEMTEMRDELPEVGVQDTAPISSIELQEVTASLSVPQLEADPDDVLSDVQSTLNSLAGMAQGLTQQKQAAGRLQEELEEWNNLLQERERLAGDKEERLLQLENHLKEAKTNLDRMAAENNRLLAERSEALKELAQTVDLRDKTTIKRAESIQLEQQRIDEQAAGLRNRTSELDERESALKRKNEELGVRLKQLQSAKDKFSTIVKSFNETVQFNSTLSAISKTVNE
ncbi:hypothetical protein [Pseudomonas nicosulfuronedens]